jgi:hypothetical protein
MHFLERGRPVADAISGYSCQASISMATARTINAGRMRIWFSTNFNASENPPPSNPIRIFEALDLAHKLQQHNDKSSNVMAALLRWCQEAWERGDIGDETFTLALFEINKALLDGGFSPVVAYLESAVGVERMGYPDEYLLPEALVGGPVLRQVLPPEKEAPSVPGSTEGGPG